MSSATKRQLRVGELVVEEDRVDDDDTVYILFRDAEAGGDARWVHSSGGGSVFLCPSTPAPSAFAQLAPVLASACVLAQAAEVNVAPSTLAAAIGVVVARLKVGLFLLYVPSYFYCESCSQFDSLPLTYLPA